MSAVRPSPPDPGALLCPRCGSTLRGDQSWCLECGLAARTRVHPPPSWRLPVLLVCVLLALAAAGIAVGLVALVGQPQASPAATTAPAATPTATTPLSTAPATTPATPTVPSTPTASTAPTVPTAPTPKTTTPSATSPPTGAVK